MKPRTKFEYLIVSLDKNIKGNKSKAIKWAMENHIKKIAYRQKSGEIKCGTCNHIFNEEKPKDRFKRHDIICPECGKSLIIFEPRKRKLYDSTIFSTLHTKRGIQVQRVFRLDVEFIRNKDCKKTIREMFRMWIDKEGHSAVTGLRRNMCYYNDIFSWTSDFELRRLNETYISLADSYVYPVYRLIPELKRNGLKRLNDELNPYILMKSLLADHRIETLFKSKDKKAFTHFFTHQYHLNLCWDSYKIAKRKGYKIKDYQMWCDMIKLLKRCGKDIRSTRYICPKDLRTEHDRWNEKVMKIERAEWDKRRIEYERERIEREIEWEKQRLEIEQKNLEQAKNRETKFIKMKSCYFGIVITDDEIEISVLDSIKSYLEESTAMHHCVYSNQYYEKPDSIILSAHYPNGERIETIEFSLKENKVIQCYGKYNKETELHDRIINLVNENAYRFIDAKRKAA